jgi:D-alanyl-D-alanine carboxypeptidase
VNVILLPLGNGVGVFSPPPHQREVVGVRRVFLLFASLSSAVLFACGMTLAVTPSGETAGNAGAEATTAAGGPDAALDRALKDLVAMEGGPPGVIAVVQRGERREVHTFGVANLKSERHMRVDDRMRIASAAKAFSGAVALSLVSKGELSLDDTIGESLSGLEEPPPDKWSDVTLGQLLNHTSGLPDFSENDAFLDAVRKRLRHPDPPAQLLSSYAYELNDGEPLFKPGTRYRYSNSDNVAVALMVEEATGDSYEDQLKKRVYRPLGLKGTSLPVGPELQKPYIHGYDISEQPPEDVSELIAAGWAWASGGVVSTPADLNTFIRGYVGGELFDRQTRSQQREVFEGGGSEPPGPGNNSAGLAVFRYETGCGTVWGHTGNTLGYTQFMASSPNGNRSATVSINAQITPTVGDSEAFKALRRAEGRAVCAALAGNG